MPSAALGPPCTGCLDRHAWPMHDLCMATKTISIEIDAYELLVRERRDPRESFSRVIRRVLSEVVRHELSAAPDDGSISRELTEQFVVGAFLTVLAWWLERRPKLTPTQVDLMFRRLVIRGIGPSI